LPGQPREVAIARIILLLSQNENRELLNAWLSAWHSVGEHETGQALEEMFDLCIVDPAALHRIRDDLQARREAELPGILPVLLVTRVSNIWDTYPNLWQIVDDVVTIPISKLELQSRVEILLRARRTSLELKLRNEDLEAFIQAMSHDLRASVRAVTMFADAVFDSQAGRMDKEAVQDLDRIRSAALEMRELIDSLLNFSRLGRGEIRYEPIDLRRYIEICLNNLQGEIRNREAHVQVKGKPPTVQTDPTLLKIALTNLLSNAIKFVPEGKRPQIVVSASVKQDLCRIQIDDNGIGIAKENQQRIFMPFVRLYSDDQFQGIGLGLPAVRKALELMGGRVGVESELGAGSTFWIEFNI
jgi:signal transduction histidine kinase